MCEGVGISDRARPAAPQRITTVGIPPAVGLRLVLMPVSLKCCSAAKFFGLVLLPFFVLLSVFGTLQQLFCLCGQAPSC